MASETQEYPSQETTHSTEELFIQETTHDVIQDPEMDEDPLLELLHTSGESSPTLEQGTVKDRPHQDPATRLRQQKVKWPKASDKAIWKLLDEDLDHILEASMQGPVNRKLQTFTSLIYTVGKERFGLEESKVRNQATALRT